MKYPAVDSGVWIAPLRRGWRMVCCDCGLTHVVDFRVKRRELQMRVFRDQRATGQIRRHRKTGTHG